MTEPMEFIYNTIRGTVEWLLTWSFRGIPFLYWLIGFAVVGAVLKFIFG